MPAGAERFDDTVRVGRRRPGYRRQSHQDQQEPENFAHGYSSFNLLAKFHFVERGALSSPVLLL
jgi:hypothetical protein